MLFLDLSRWITESKTRVPYIRNCCLRRVIFDPRLLVTRNFSTIKAITIYVTRQSLYLSIPFTKSKSSVHSERCSFPKIRFQTVERKSESSWKKQYLTIRVFHWNITRFKRRSMDAIGPLQSLVCHVVGGENGRVVGKPRRWSQSAYSKYREAGWESNKEKKETERKVATTDGAGREFSQGKTRLRLFPKRRKFFVFLNEVSPRRKAYTRTFSSPVALLRTSFSHPPGHARFFQLAPRACFFQRGKPIAII